jgi:beta-1,4-mannosyltransferase
LIIDWHNYGYSIMRVNNVNSLLVFLAKIYELYFGKIADYNLCVSQAMKKDLMNKFNLKQVHVLYDKATNKFKELGVKEKHLLLKKINLDFLLLSNGDEETLLTTYSSEK